MKKLSQWYRSFLKSMQLQLFLSFISLPFLIGWGLPISILTPISTLLFGPFLTCFLLISSLIFFCEIVYIPNGFLIWCLEKTTAIWLLCLNLEQRSWLIGFIKPPIIILMLIPLIALAAAHSKKINSAHSRTLLLGGLLVVICFLLKIFPYDHEPLHAIACHKGTITLMNYKNTLILIDPAFIASKPSYESYISYTLLPEIIEKTGRLHIDHVIVSKFNTRILDALQFLATKITIKNLYIPAWKGRIPNFAWRSYVKLKRTTASSQGKIVSISKIKKIYLDETSTIFIEPDSKKNVLYYDASYTPLSIRGTINNQTFVI